MSQAPKLPPLFPASLHVVYVVFTWFSNGTTDPKQKIKQPKTNLQPLSWEKATSEVLPVWCCFASPSQKQTTNQNTNKPNKQKHKKQKTHSHTQKKKHEMIGPNSPLEVYNLSD